MHLNNESYRRIMENLPDGLYIVDTARRITYWNPAAERISGFSAEEVMGNSCFGNILCHIDHAGANLCCGSCPLSIAIGEGEYQREIYLHHKDGHRVPVSVRTTPLTGDQGEVIGGFMIFTDLSSRAADEQRLKELEELTLLDGLTRLANRSYLERELEARLEERDRYGVPFGVMFMDIDNFKQVNDRYGHDVGDRVLKFVAATFNANSRAFDLYGRWGGEEFVGIARNVSAEDLEQMAQRLRKLVEKSFVMVGEKRLQVTISIGATMAGETDCIASVVNRADVLMYRSKAEGKNRVTMG
jgi:diguanylate cyclase (GGDEF)-like protein/PAS domain S-box-containing protein